MKAMEKSKRSAILDRSGTKQFRAANSTAIYSPIVRLPPGTRLSAGRVNGKYVLVIE
jgi:hypothetical protein